mmetsp:Transcript_50506/g.108950  ORF Transcript_50506/g.108950 Transcript_50506/m.108950 type:complete len:88 (-) Transcript_50506:18-281(-)
MKERAERRIGKVAKPKTKTKREKRRNEADPGRIVADPGLDLVTGAAPAEADPVGGDARALRAAAKAQAAPLGAIGNQRPRARLRDQL